MFGRKKEKHHTSEREFIGEQSLRQQRLDHELDTLLDQLLRLFPSVPGLMAEILVPSGGNAQLITARIRPDESVALPIRVRRGEGTIGALFQSGQPFAGSRSDAGRISHSGSRGDVTHLLRTRSLLVIPISSHHRALGVLNLESPRDNTFTRDSLALVQESAAYKSLVDHLTTMTLETLSDDEIARNLVGKLRQQVAFAIDPSDLDSTYYQILQAAAQIINAPDISAGLVLVRDDSQRLAPVAGSRTNSPKQLWAVLASKLGAFNPDPAEWKLEAFSIAGRVIEQRQSELIPNVDGYPGYRDSGTGYKESSELIVPLVDGDHALGVIGLVSPALNTFTKTDQQHVEEIAKIAVYAIKRGEDILAAKRSELQLRLADELNEDFKQFFPPNVEAIRDLNIRDIRNRMYDKILRWAREHADADHAAIVLPEFIRDTQTNTQNDAQPHSTSLTYLTVHRDNGEHLDTAPPRWLATEGVTGRAYSSGGTAEEPEIAKKSGSTAVVEYYIDAASEVAAPMKRGDEVIGVLDVESKKDHHFTTAHIRWVEFLARQTALVLIAAELALKTQLELKLERLARDTDRVSQEIREADLDKVRKEVRDPQLLKILTEVCEITGSSVGRILIAMNAYKSPADDAIDVATGVLYFMVSTDPSETASDSVRYFPISEGASGTAFRQSREIIFRDEFSREEANYSRRSRDSLSGMILPIFEGSRIVGVVGFEADRKDAYTPDYALVGRRAAAMISRLLVVARLRISRSTTRMLRDFESSMLQLENKTIETFMEEVLQRTALLSDIKDGWGQLILLRPSTDSTTLIADRIFGATYQKDAVSDDTVSNFDPGTSDTREEILGSAFREAIIEQRPVLVLDVSHASTDFHLPRPAQSFICVPLLRPNEITYPSEVDAAPALTTQSATVERAIGLLVVASPSRSEFSEADKEILTPFTQTIVYGLQTLALLGSREELMTELSHDFTTAYPSLQGSIRNVQAPLDAALGSEDIATVHHYIRSVNGQIRQLRSLVRLTQNMLRWFFDLARDDIRSDEVATDLANQQLSGEHQLEVIAGRSDHLSTEQILRDIQEPVTTLAELRREGFSIKWEHPAPPLYVATSRDDANLIAAVLFKFLDNAIKKTEKNDITVTCTQDQSGMNEPSVVFRVTNSGRPIDKLDRPLLFRLRFRPGSRHGSGSTGIGLYQARMIARKLGGDVGYETDEVDRNTFWFSLPARGDAD